jgi:hypothetical protein
MVSPLVLGLRYHLQFFCFHSATLYYFRQLPAHLNVLVYFLQFCLLLARLKTRCAAVNFKLTLYFKVLLQTRRRCSTQITPKSNLNPEHNSHTPMETAQSIAHILIKSLATALGLLMLPVIGSFTIDGFHWTTGDYVLAFILFLVPTLAYRLITRTATNFKYRLAIAFALLTGFATVWINLAVGIIGSEDELINLAYFGILALGLIAANIFRFKPEDMVKVMAAMTAALVPITIVALVLGYQNLPHSSVMQIIGVNAFFGVLYAQSAFLFRYASKKSDKQQLANS